jgi:sterol desaturase/sphingolipid hydroxylase (fatty acid hydroxylase superfamily)
MLCEDAYYYVLHRIFHLRAFYKYHKLHHRYTINVSIAAEYTHPVDFLVVSLVSIAVGPLILGKSLHFYTWLLYFSLRTVESIDSHCGYEFPWSPVKCLPL